ncbi:MAG: 4-(cytidine 5'-diphospho)-2-C-methyl-D-erythritol kinase [Verrucomicrobiae bacterium]|jgi:4-diphosphocytidyl-2-C-methyl-D-erythritol kinase|nr:4-(cytidine 5'-diphospho)-2-C-methyl-D-erythritol kinase [Verrucomicrobiae bacterium]
MKVALQSPCKINLLLNILRKREDGFHEMETVMQPVALFDELEFSETAAGIVIDGSHPELKSDAGNLIYRAAESFLDAAKIESGVHIRHEKRLPIAAGLAGGSANAATTLRGLNELFGRPLTHDQLHEIAARHGSDINFFLQDGPALATGRGEKIEPLKPFPALSGKGLLLMKPGFGVPTPWAFRKLAEFPEAITDDPTKGRALIAALNGPDLAAAAPHFFNSLEAPVLPKYPILRLYLEFCRTQGAVVAMMSGSGSTTFAIAESPDAAADLEARFRSKFGESPWCRSLPLSCE